MDSEIEQCLQAYGAVCIEGPKSSGKTWAAARHAQSAIYLTDPSQNFANRAMTDISLDYALNGTRPHLIDEWQEVPELWDAVRFKVDETTKKGQFLLTGSSTPVVKGVLHSGAGRIVRLRMRPMSLHESGDSTGEASLHAICTGADIPVLSAETSIERLAQLIVRGGWPGTLALPYEAGARFARDYMNTITHHDLPRLEETRRDIQKVELLLRSLARNESTTASIRTLCRDVEAREGESLGRDTASQYLSVLDRLFLLDNQEPFGFGDRAAARLKIVEKRHFVDPSLACALLDITAEGMVADPRTFGFLFEALCERDLRIYAESFGGRLRHYQDYQEREIDAVVEMPDRTWCAIEIKLGAKQIDAAAAQLLKIKAALPPDLAPSSLAVVCGLPGGMYQRKDGVYVVPITALRP